MGNEAMHEQLKQSIVDQDADAVLEAVEKALAEGMDPREVIDKGLLPGLNVIGEQFECEDIFLPELMQAALAFQSAMTVQPAAPTRRRARS
jgi:methanogenic corrinoid protein MtbC1